MFGISFLFGFKVLLLVNLLLYDGQLSAHGMAVLSHFQDLLVALLASHGRVLTSPVHSIASLSAIRKDTEILGFTFRTSDMANDSTRKYEII